MKLVQYIPNQKVDTKQISINKSGMLTIPHSLHLFDSNWEKVGIYTDDEQETIQSELKLYIANVEPDAKGYIIRDEKKVSRLNISSLLKSKFPKFKVGHIPFRIKQIEGITYIVLTIGVLSAEE